jgi:putative membrane protein
MYLFLVVIFYMFVSVIGIVLIPFWIIGPGQWWSRRYYQRLKCVLRERELYFRRGILVRAESTIPLDRITDLTVKEGPLLRALGLSMMHVETPGTSGAGGVGGVSLIGIINTPEFRDRVLAQRDDLLSQASPRPGGREESLSEELALLREIRDSVRNIAASVEARTPDNSPRS